MRLVRKLVIFKLTFRQPVIRNLVSSSSSKFYFQQNTTMEQYQEKENTL